MSSVHILQRPDDLVLLGLRWTDMEIVGSELVASSGGGGMTLLFPPQHIAEQVDMVGSEPVDAAGTPVWRAQLAATSAVAFAVPAGTRIPLTVDGVLTASARAEYLREGTVIEIPWSLHLAPGSATWRHSAQPIVSPDGVVGLWRTRSASPASPVEVFAVDDGAAQTPDPFPIPLSLADRTIIASRGPTQPAFARRLELTTLGGTLTAVGRWPGFVWDHDAVLGRDVIVHTVAAVRMWPFGHLAELTAVSRRVFDAATGTAALRKTLTLQFVEPVVASPLGGAAGRAFPFDSIEVLETTFADLPEQDWEFFTRGSGSLADLQAERDAKIGRRNEIAPIVAAESTRDRAMEELAGWAPVDRLWQLNEAMGPLATMLAEAEAAWQQSGHLLTQLAEQEELLAELLRSQIGPDGQYDPSVDEQIRTASARIDELRAATVGLPSSQLMQQWRNQIAPLEQEAAPLRAVVEAELTRDRPLEDLVAGGMTEAIELQGLDPLIADLEARIRIEAEESNRQHPWYFTPTDPSGVIRFPVRLSGAEGDVDASVPMIAVREFELPASGPLPAFTSVTDPETILALTRRWEEAEAQAVPVAPTRVDLVRSVSPEPGDVRVIHALGIVGALIEGGYRAQLASFTVELPEVATLLHEVAPVPYRYAHEFLEGEAADLVFETVGDAVDLSFVDDARNAGALLSPRILADGLSRAYGPVNLEGMRSAGIDGLYDASKLFADGATLLGFDLAALVKQLPVPPSLVTDLVAGKPPVVRMTWTDVPLQSFGPLVADERTRLELDVLVSETESTVTCRVRDFALAMPSPDTELLRLHFDELGYTLRPSEGPSLSVKGLGAEFRGELRLLEALQGAVSIGENGPTISATPNGIAARYQMAVPPVATGAFQLRDIVFRAGVDVPFGKESPTVSIAFASRERPFTATVLMFGGGGYVDLVLDHRGIRSLEASIEFGAAIAVDFFVVEAEVHVLGAIRYGQSGGTIALTGYLRMGGCVKVLGLVSVSVELVLSLSYESESNALVGRATLVLELDLTLYSTSIELDTGPWIISGGDGRGTSAESFSEDEKGEALGAGERADPDVFLEQWHAYRGAFA